jgi:DNA-binding XRE family transcriptional regulator
MANKLKEMRYKRMMSMSELARKSGVCRSTIWKIETQPDNSPNERTMIALAKALNMPVTKIFFTNG